MVSPAGCLYTCTASVGKSVLFLLYMYPLQGHSFLVQHLEYSFVITSIFPSLPFVIPSVDTGTLVVFTCHFKSVRTP